MEVTSKLIKKYRKDTKRDEYALVSKKDPNKILKWFGVKKPSHEAVLKQERRVQYFKHVKGSFLHKLKNKYAVAESIEQILKPAVREGNLSLDEDWSLVSMEYLEGEHDEVHFDTCDHCGRKIRYVIHIAPDAKVGPDCAMTLLKEKDKKEVERFVGAKHKQIKFVRDAIKYLSELEVTENEENNFIHDFLNKIPAQKYPNITYKDLITKPGLLRNLSLITKADEVSIKSLSNKKIIKELDEKKLIEALKDAFYSKTIQKKYLFDPKSGNSNFISDYEDKLLINIGEINLVGTAWFILP